MPHKLIGRTTDFKGKNLWQIIGNLKNFGVGRCFARNMFQRYPEPSYNKILQVEALPNPAPSYDVQRKAIVLVERVFRGLKQEFPVQMESATYKSDYFLIHKCDLHKFTDCKEVWDKKPLPTTMKLPPLLSYYLTQQQKKSNPDKVEEPRMKIIYNRAGIKKYQPVSSETDTQLPEITVGLGTPASPELYKSIEK